jgi:uncharacterized membrane protein/mono/diheme cytochrome c family protein
VTTKRVALAFAIALVIALLPRAARADAARGHALLKSKGCLTCHSTDGTPRAGPTFRGLWGARHVVRSGETELHEVVVDEAYLARSLRDPDADIPAGYMRGTMPRFDLGDEDVHAMAEAIQEISSGAETPSTSGARRGGSIIPLLLAAASFVGFHLLLSSVAVRKRLIGSLKQSGFAGLYSLIAFASFGAMVWFYRTAPYVEVWQPPRPTRWVPLLTMPIAIAFMVFGFSTPSPTSVAQGEKAKDEKSAFGIFAITRHPALTGFALWGLSHLAPNGELHVIIVALAIVTLAISGMLHIDARRAKDLGEVWTHYRAKTSIFPFLALAQGRAKLGTMGAAYWLVRVLIAVFIYTAILHTHALVIGASPYP